MNIFNNLILFIIAFDIADNGDEIQVALSDFENIYKLEDNVTLYAEYESLSDKAKNNAYEIMSEGECDYEM